MTLSTHRSARALALGATLLTLVLCGLRPPISLAAPAPQTWNFAGDLAAGRTLTIHGVNGAIVVARGAGSRVEVKAFKTGRKDDPSQVRIVSTQDSDGITICAIYPGSDSPCEHSVVPKLRHNPSCDVLVRFDVNLPAGVNLSANSVNGDVRVHGLTGHLAAHTVNGECEVETAGSGEASTVNGSVSAAIGRANHGDHLEFTSVNGNVTLSLPPGLDAEVEGSTVNGAVESDFASASSGQWSHFHTATTLGHGGAHVSASTVNGSVHLRRAAAR